MSYADKFEREQVLMETLEARTPQKVELATQQLRQWVKTPPDDLVQKRWRKFRHKRTQ